MTDDVSKTARLIRRTWLRRCEFDEMEGWVALHGLEVERERERSRQTEEGGSQVGAEGLRAVSSASAGGRRSFEDPQTQVKRGCRVVIP